MGRNRRRWPWVLGAVLLLVLSVWYVRTRYYGPMTCGSGEADVLQYLEERRGRSVTVLKTAREGRVQAALFQEHSDGDRYVIVFERQLFGLRLRQVGMNTWNEDGLHLGGSWHTGGRCQVEIYGDNRSGAVKSYSMADAPEVFRENLESDYILDIYTLDGIDHLPRKLQQEFSGEEERN